MNFSISSATGKCTLKAKNMETMEALFKVFESQKNIDTYYTLIKCEFEPKKVHDDFILTFNFCGKGRLWYKKNIEFFCKWTKEFLSKEDIKTLVHNEWSIYYTFHDENRLVRDNFIYTAEIELLHLAKTEYEDTLCVKCRHKEYDRTALSFIILGFYENLDEFIEWEIFFMNGKELDIPWVFERLGDLNALADYYGCSVNELRSRFNMLDELLKIKEKLEREGE